MNKVIFLFDADIYDREQVEGFTFDECEKLYYSYDNEKNNNIMIIYLDGLESQLNDGWDIFCNNWARVFI